MRPNSTDYQVLTVIDNCGGSATTADVCHATGKSKRYISERVARMVHPNFDAGEPWIERTSDGLELSERGAQALYGARQNPLIVSASRMRAWIDNALWPTDEAFSNLENVAIPGPERAPVQDPEVCAWRQNGRVLPQQHEIDEDEMRKAWRRLIDM